MSDHNPINVELPEDLVSEFQSRADAANFESTDKYIEYVLRAVATELEPVPETSEAEEVNSRLKLLGYLDS